MEQIDIWRTANFLIKQHGEDTASTHVLLDSHPMPACAMILPHRMLAVCETLDRGTI